MDCKTSNCAKIGFVVIDDGDLEAIVFAGFRLARLPMELACVGIEEGIRSGARQEEASSARLRRNSESYLVIWNRADIGKDWHYGRLC